MMNERIEKLWNEAAEYSAAFPSGQNNSWETQVNFMEKFAELIVKECMNICKAHPSRIVSNNWRADAVTPDIVRRLEEHFGVEL